MPARVLLAYPGTEMLTQGESEGLQTLGIVVVLCSSLKLLHYLGLIDLSDGKRAPRASPFYTNVFSSLDCCESISGAGGKYAENGTGVLED